MPIEPTVDLITLGLQILFFVLLFAFTLHSVFLGYHWFTYGSSKRMSTTALCIYLCGGAIFLLLYAAGLNTV